MRQHGNVWECAGREEGRFGQVTREKKNKRLYISEILTMFPLCLLSMFRHAVQCLPAREKHPFRLTPKSCYHSRCELVFPHFLGHVSFSGQGTFSKRFTPELPLRGCRSLHGNGLVHEMEGPQGLVRAFKALSCGCFFFSFFFQKYAWDKTRAKSF